MPAFYWCGYGNQFLSKINQYSVKKPTLLGRIQTILCGFKSALNRGPHYLNLHYTVIPCTRVIIDHILLVGIDHFLLVGIDLIYKINKKQVGSGIIPVLISLVIFRSLHGNVFFLPHGLKSHNITNSQVFLIKDITFSSLLVYYWPIREWNFPI